MALTDTQFIPEWTLGDRLAKARKDGAGLNQEQMAERLDVKPSTLAAWESDRSRPRDLAGIAQQWAEITGADPAWLLGFRTGSFSPHPHFDLVTNPNPLQGTLAFDRHLEPV